MAWILAPEDVFSPLTVDGKLLVLDVQLDEGQPGVEPVPALERPRVDSRVGRRLDVTRLQPAVAELALAVRPGKTDAMSTSSSSSFGVTIPEQ